MTDVIVYEHPLSPYVQKVKIALLEKGVAFRVVGPGAPADEMQAGFGPQNPRLEVPLFLHGDTAVFDSTIILEYIEDAWPDPSLLPKAPARRARVRMIEEAMDTHFEANTWGLGEVRVFGRGGAELGPDLDRFACDEIAAWYRWLDAELGRSEWFNGSDFGWGDLCVIPFVNGAARFDLLPEADTGLARWLARINGRPAVSEVTAAARSAELDPATMKEAVAQGFKREYRDHRLEWMVRAGGLQVVADGIAAGNLRFATPFPPRHASERNEGS